MKKVLALFGAGLSIPAKMPSTYEITDHVLSGHNVMRHTDGNYYFGKPLYHHIVEEDEYVPRVTRFLKRIKTEIDAYYANIPNKIANYEDLYYISSQIYDSEMFNYDNPVVQPFIDKILDDIIPLFAAKPGEIHQDWKLHELASESMNYIQDIVWHRLDKKPLESSYLSFLQDAFNDTDLQQLFIFTLNHDLLIEKYLDSLDIPFLDGFGEPVNNVRYWDFDNFQKQHKIALIKLHGSINWFKFSRDSYSPDAIGIPLDWDFWHTIGPDNFQQNPLLGRPMFLVGTFNKILQYTYDIFFLLYYLFYIKLNEVKTVIISGYSFGDKGINTRLIEWMYARKDNKIIMIHPEPDALKKSSRGAIYKNWGNWYNNGKLIIIPKGIEKASWSELSNIAGI